MTVIMPFLYEGRVHNRGGRESLDCAQMLKELVRMGVTNIITFDANDPRVQNAIPLHGFDTVSPTYQYIKALCRSFDDLEFDSGHMMVVSPDEPGMRRAIYFAGVLGVDMGLFYQRKDHSVKIDGKNPVIANEFLGSDPAGKDVIIVDDMISSGYTVLDTAEELKRRNARRVFVCVSFGLFTNGLERFDQACRDGVVDRIFTTNLVYQPPELLEKSWYTSVDMSKYMALLIDALNHDYTISKLLNPFDRINAVLAEYKEKRNR
jgi:ribose-phosphate pyrophosphokinase